MSDVGNPLVQYGSGQYGAQPIEMLPLGYYLGLVTSEYRDSPKFLQFLSVLLQKLDDVSQCLVSMDTAFDIDNAVGAQLDIVGACVGASRVVGFQPTGGVSPVLDDDTYRLLIRAKAAQNQWDGKIDSMQGIWRTLFPNGNITIADNQDMSATIIMTGQFTSIQKDLISNGYIVPRPQAVLYNYIFPTLPILGFDLDDSFIAGFDKGHWT